MRVRHCVACTVQAVPPQRYFYISSPAFACKFSDFSGRVSIVIPQQAFRRNRAVCFVEDVHKSCICLSCAMHSGLLNSGSCHYFIYIKTWIACTTRGFPPVQSVVVAMLFSHDIFFLFSNTFLGRRERCTLVAGSRIGPSAPVFVSSAWTEGCTVSQKKKDRRMHRGRQDDVCMHARWRHGCDV